MTQKIRVVIKRPGQPATIEERLPTREAYEQIVGGKLEVIKLEGLPRGTTLYANAAGKSLDLEPCIPLLGKMAHAALLQGVPPRIKGNPQLVPNSATPAAQDVGEEDVEDVVVGTIAVAGFNDQRGHHEMQIPEAQGVARLLDTLGMKLKEAQGDEVEREEVQQEDAEEAAAEVAASGTGNDSGLGSLPKSDAEHRRDNPTEAPPVNEPPASPPVANVSAAPPAGSPVNPLSPQQLQAAQRRDEQLRAEGAASANLHEERRAKGKEGKGGGKDKDDDKSSSRSKDA